MTIPEDVRTESQDEVEEGQDPEKLMPEVYRLHAVLPAEPSDVNWENQAYTGVQIFFRRSVVYFLTFVVFVVGFILLMGLKLLFVSRI